MRRWQPRVKSKRLIQSHGLESYVRQVIPSLFAVDNRSKYRSTIEILVERAAAYNPKGVLNALQAMHDRPDRSAVLREINCPVLFIIGEKDEVVLFVDAV